MEKIITDANIAEIEAAGLPIVIDFSATWCGPCKKIAPIIEELAEEYEGRVIIGKCDVVDHVERNSRLGYRRGPAVVFVKNGRRED